MNYEKMLKVKPLQEKLYSSYCGPASLKIVLDYFGVKKSEDELAKLTKTDKNLGTDDWRIKKAAESLGFKVKIKEHCSFKDIEKWLDKKVPIIVDWFTCGRKDYPEEIFVPDGHYSVVAGLDKKYIYLQDPEIGRIRKLNRDNFLNVWFDYRGKYIKPDELIIRQIIAIYK